MNIQTIVANPALAACWLSEAPREEVEAFAAQISCRAASIPAEGRAFLQDLRDRLRPQSLVDAAGPAGVLEMVPRTFHEERGLINAPTLAV